MIKLTKINGKDIVINSELIEFIEHLGDTIITLTTGNKIMVKNSLDDIIKKVENFRRESQKNNH